MVIPSGDFVGTMLESQLFPKYTKAKTLAPDSSEQKAWADSQKLRLCDVIADG